MAAKRKPQPQPPVMRERTIFDYQPDTHNANLGTPSGLAMVEDSLREDGAGRSIVVDKNDKIPAGNKTQEAAVNVGITKVVEVETDGDVLLVHKRRDWDLEDDKGPARRYAIRDNLASAKSLVWDANEIARLNSQGADLTMFQPWEINNLLGIVPTPIDRQGMWNGMPGYEQNDEELFHTLKLHFKTEADMVAFAQLVNQTITKQTLYLYYPKLLPASRKSHQVIDEPHEDKE